MSMILLDKGNGAQTLRLESEDKVRVLELLFVFGKPMAAFVQVNYAPAPAERAFRTSEQVGALTARRIDRFLSRWGIPAESIEPHLFYQRVRTHHRRDYVFST